MTSTFGCAELECSEEAHAVIEIPELPNFGKPAFWMPICEQHLGDYKLDTRVVDFAGA